MKKIEIKTFFKNKINNFPIKFNFYFQTMKNKLVKSNLRCLVKILK